MVKITESELIQWFDFAERLDDLNSFNFYGVTLRKEKRRHGYFWYAYKRINGRLFNLYCGDKWKLREILPHAKNELMKKSRGEVKPISPSTKIDDKIDWFEKWIMG